MRSITRVSILLLSLAFITAPDYGQAGSDAGPVVRVTVTAMPHRKDKVQPLNSQDVLVREGKSRRPLVDFTPAGGANSDLDLAILIDDSLDTTFDTQLNALRQFVQNLPSRVRVAIVYGELGTASVLQNLTTNHALAAKALRLPLGRVNEQSSIYFSVMDLMKSWPARSRRHAVLLFSDGIDLFNGIMDSEPGINPDLQDAIDAAQRAGVTIYTIYANTAGFTRQNMFLVNNGQSCLGLLALSTGGEAYQEGFNTPVDLTPFLKQMLVRLNNQYLVSFRALPAKKAEFQQVKFTTELPGMELQGPERVFVPASE